MNEENRQQEVPVDAMVVKQALKKQPSDWNEELRQLGRWLYTNNPFYAISAALVFVGLVMSFDTSGPVFETGALMTGLAAYTLLLAATALFLIRYGDLWQDVRTVLLLVVLMLLATSVSLDRSLVENPDLAIPMA